MSDASRPGDDEASTLSAPTDHVDQVTGTDAGARDLTSVPPPPSTKDPDVDAILAEFVKQSADREDLNARIEGATNAHRHLQARLCAHREH